MRRLYTLRKFFISLVDLGLILLATQIASSLVLSPTINALSHYTGPTTFSVAAYIFFFYIFELYSSGITSSWRESLFRIVWSFALGFISTGFIFYILGHWQYPQDVFLVQVLLGIIFISAWRWIYCKYLRKPMHEEGTIIVGAGRAGHSVLTLLQEKTNPFKVQGFIDNDPQKQNQHINSIPVLGDLSQLRKQARELGTEHVILAITHDRTDELMHSLLEIRLAGIRVHEMTSIFEQLARRIPARHIQERWILFESGFDIISHSSVQHTKRILDIISAALTLAITSPLILIAAIAIKIDSSGPVIFRQTRVGLNNEKFILYKFRSMCTNAEKNGAVWARENDPRVTRAGKWLRLLRIDELPQLINVLRGDMSMIGPRPERPEFVDDLEKQLPYYYIRHLVRPGITGWAQVNYPYGATVEDALCKLEYDLYYVKNMSFFLEAKIVLRTIGVMLFGKGAR